MNLLKQGEFKVGVFFSNEMQATSEIVNIRGVSSVLLGRDQ